MIQTTHKGYKLSFYEHNEHWSCAELDVDSESLAGAKAQIDNLTRNDRRLMVPALLVQGGAGMFHNKPSIEPVVVTLIAAKREKGRMSYRDEVEQVHIEKADGEREKVRVDQLFPLDARAELLGWIALCRKAEEATKLATAAGKEIAHHTHDTLALANREAKATKAAEAEA
jgi:hypothetical protein